MNSYTEETVRKKPGKLENMVVKASKAKGQRKQQQQYKHKRMTCVTATTDWHMYNQTTEGQEKNLLNQWHPASFKSVPSWAPNKLWGLLGNIDLRNHKDMLFSQQYQEIADKCYSTKIVSSRKSKF